MLKAVLQVGAGIAIAAAAVASCSSSSSTTWGPGEDGGGGSSGASGSSSGGSGGSSGSGSSSGGGSGSSSGGSSGGDAGTGPMSVAFVNASPSLGDVRLCWTIGNASLDTQRPFPSDAPMPASNYPGVPAGGAVLLQDASKLADAELALYALNAKLVAWVENANLATPPTCEQLACDGPSADCLGSGSYFALPPVHLDPSGFQLVALSGCLARALDSAASTARCGADWDPTGGNLHAEVLSVASSTGSAGALAMQAAQLSPGLASMGAVEVSLGTTAAVQATIATLDSEGQVAPQAPTPIAIGNGLSAFGQVGIGVDVTGADAGIAGHLWMSLAQAQSLFDPATDPSHYYGQGATYVVAVVGDPNAPHAFSSSGAAAYDGTGLHVLVLPAGAP